MRVRRRPRRQKQKAPARRAGAITVRNCDRNQTFARPIEKAQSANRANKKKPPAQELCAGAAIGAGALGAVTIGGNLAGGTGDSSGTVSANGTTLASITIGGSLIGGGTTANQFTGAIFSRGDMGAVKIRGDVLGGVGGSGGFILSFGKLASVSIGGSLVGGAGNSSGVIPRPRRSAPSRSGTICSAAVSLRGRCRSLARAPSSARSASAASSSAARSSSASMAPATSSMGA